MISQGTCIVGAVFGVCSNLLLGSYTRGMHLGGGGGGALLRYRFVGFRGFAGCEEELDDRLTLERLFRGSTKLEDYFARNRKCYVVKTNCSTPLCLVTRIEKLLSSVFWPKYLVGLSTLCCGGLLV